MHPLLGYVDRWSVRPGETIKLMVSSAGGAPFEARFAPVICGDPNPRGPGYREIAMAHPLAGRHAGKDQPRNARTGEFTPPGMCLSASANSSSDLLRAIIPAK